MRKTREEKAITLIALIITIVVLLILAVVAINSVTGDGIIQHATNAKTQYEESKIKEQEMLDSYLDKITEKLPNDNIDYDNVMRSVAHKGYSLIAPENTIPAFALAKQEGFKYVETDVRFTSDGVAVLLHDASINRFARNSDGSELSETVNIADITYEQALTYDFGIWKHEDYAGTQIPTFEEFVGFCKNNDLRALIELKTNISESQVQELMRILEEHDMKGNVEWSSFRYNELEQIKKYDNTATLILSVETVTNNHISAMQNFKTTENKVIIATSDYSNASIDLCKEANLPVMVWTINDSGIIKNLDPYVTSVVSDYLHAGKILYNEKENPSPYLSEYELVKQLDSSDIKYGFSWAMAKPYYKESASRAIYFDFDIPIEYGYIYKFEFSSTVDTAGIAVQLYNEKAVTETKHGRSISSYTYLKDDIGWQSSGFECEIPEILGECQVKAARLIFKMNESLPVEEGFITSVTISRKSV